MPAVVLVLLSVAVPFLLAQHPALTKSDRSGTVAPQLSFVQNRGQLDARARYYGRTSGFSAYFTDRKAVLDLRRGSRGAVLELRFQGANAHPRVTAADRVPGTINYFEGSRRFAGLRGYGEVRYHGLWPGIDLAFRSVAGTLKYEFLVQPGADPSKIRLAYAGANSLSLERGALAVGTNAGTLKDGAPLVRQGSRAVPGRYTLSGASFAFALGAYDHSRSLVIDPGLVYSTFLGGTGEDVAKSIAVGTDGSAYVAGHIIGGGFPTTLGAYDTTYDSDNGYDAFVTKLDPGGSLVYSTYLGGHSDASGDFSGSDYGKGIAVDSAGQAYVFGTTESIDFPTTPGAYRSSPQIGSTNFVTKLGPSGDALDYSTLIGGADTSSGGIAIDGQGHVYITGGTFDSTYPTTPGAYRTTYPGGRSVYVTKLNSSGTALDYSTFLGSGAGYGIKVDSLGHAYATGYAQGSGFATTTGAYDTTANGGADVFVTKLNTTGTALDYSTYIGGTQDDRGFALAIDGSGNAYVTGWVESTGYPTTAGAYSTTPLDDNFVTKVNASGSALVYSTFLPGRGQGIALDQQDDAYVSGAITSDSSLPVTPGTYDGSLAGPSDAILIKLDSAGSGLLYTTYLGGGNADTAWAVDVGSQGDAYLAGETTSPDYPTTPGAFDTTYGGSPNRDGFVTRISIPAPDAYARPRGASPARFSLVPSNVQCTEPTITHGAPLSFPSCAGPQVTSSYLTTGTPDSNGKPVRMEAYLLAKVRVGNLATPADEADIKLSLHVPDVLTNALDDYTGELRALLTVRITDKDPGGNATTIDFPFGFNASCVADPDPALGSLCDATTTADAVMPGAVNEGLRAVWALDKARVFDGGPDGDADTAAGNTQFLTQGIFIP